MVCQSRQSGLPSLNRPPNKNRRWKTGGAVVLGIYNKLKQIKGSFNFCMDFYRKGTSFVKKYIGTKDSGIKCLISLKMNEFAYFTTPGGRRLLGGIAKGNEDRQFISIPYFQDLLSPVMFNGAYYHGPQSYAVGGQRDGLRGYAQVEHEPVA